MGKQRSCRIDLTIRQEDDKGKVVETTYHVKPISSAIHIRAYQFRKDSGETYHVTQDITGRVNCDCGAGTFRDENCKHGRCGRRAGLFLSPAEIQAVRWHSERKKVNK